MNSGTPKGLAVPVPNVEVVMRREKNMMNYIE
jgi:hypothetical protein